MVAQRVLEELDRSPKLPAAESGAADLPAATARADKYLAFDSNGDPIASSGPLGDSNVPISGLMQNLLNDATTGDAQDTLGGTAVGKSVFIAATTDVALDAVKGVKQGKHTIWIPAAAMRPTVSAGCVALTDIQTTAGNPDLQVFDFVSTTDKHAQFQMAFPKSWDEGTITFQVYWTTAAAVTTGVAWSLQGVAVSDGDSAGVAYGVAVPVTDNAQSGAEQVLITSESGAVTIAGTPAGGDLVFFRIFRDVDDPGDTMTEDARLLAGC